MGGKQLPGRAAQVLLGLSRAASLKFSVEMLWTAERFLPRPVDPKTPHPENASGAFRKQRKAQMGLGLILSFEWK